MSDFAFRSSESKRRAKTGEHPTPRNPWTGKEKPIKRRELETRVMDEQHENISKRFGHEAAEKANYGWGVSGDKGTVSVATKVYHPKGARVITSDAEVGDTGASHRWSKY